MSTNALIGTKNEDGTIDTIYLHSDGYTEHALTMLTTHYASSEAAAELVSLGDCSQLDKNLELSTFYARDRGEPMADVKAQRLADASAFLAAAFEYPHAYLWDGAEWKHWQPKR